MLIDHFEDGHNAFLRGEKPVMKPVYIDEQFSEWLDGWLSAWEESERDVCTVKE